MLSWSLNVFSHSGVFLISVKPLTTENTQKQNFTENLQNHSICMPTKAEYDTKDRCKHKERCRWG